MNRITTPLVLILAVLTALALNGWRSSGKRLQTARADLTTVSNRLTEATAKLAEQGVATETLRVQLNLQRTDLAAASNRVNELSAQIAQATDRTRELERRLQQRAEEAASLARTNVLLLKQLDDLKARAAQLEVALAKAGVEAAETAQRLSATRSALNDSEAARAALLRKLNDPATLRAQLRAVTTPPCGEPQKGKAPLILQPDGTVTLVSAITNAPVP